MSTDAGFDERAAAALAAEEGIDWETAKRYAAILRREGVLKAGSDIRRIEVKVAKDAPTSVDIALQNGFRVAGELAAPQWTGVWSNPFLEGSTP